MAYLIDTNHCSAIINGDPQITDKLQSISSETVSVSIITHAELLYMAERSAQKEKNLEVIHKFLSEVEIYFLDEETASIYSSLKAKVFNQFAPRDKNKRRSVTIEKLGFTDHDLWIVATAIQHDLTLVSADSDFSRIHQVDSFSLESWKKKPS